MTASHLRALEVPRDDLNAVTRFEIMNEDFEDFPDPYRNVWYLVLKNEGKKAAQICRSVYSILRQEQLKNMPR